MQIPMMLRFQRPFYFNAICVHIMLFTKTENNLAPKGLNFHFSVQFSNIKIFHCSFLRNCEAYKVETWYRHGQWVDVLFTGIRLLLHICPFSFSFFFLHFLFQINWPEEVKPHLYFSHSLNTKTVIFVLA